MKNILIMLCTYWLFGILSCSNPEKPEITDNYFGNWKGIWSSSVDYDSLGNILNQKDLSSDSNGYEWILKITDSNSIDYDHRQNDSVYYSMLDTLFYRNNKFNPKDSIRFHNPETYLAYSFSQREDTLIYRMWSDMIDTSWDAKGSKSNFVVTYYKRYFGPIPQSNWPNKKLNIN
jgi:hypothetical protein